MPVPEEEDRGHPGVTLVARTHLKRVGHLKHKDSGREHMTGTDTLIGHVTSVIAGYLYQPLMENGISPEPELYKCNTIPILVNIAKIVLTSWISFPNSIVTIYYY